MTAIFLQKSAEHSHRFLLIFPVDITGITVHGILGREDIRVYEVGGFVKYRFYGSCRIFLQLFLYVQHHQAGGSDHQNKKKDKKRLENL